MFPLVSRNIDECMVSYKKFYLNSPVLSLFLILGIGFLGGCTRSKSDPSVLIQTDKAFSQMSLDKGFNAAFLFYAADSVIKTRDGQFPIIGKNEMTRIFLARPDSGIILKWVLLKAEISQSDDLGYTFGNWELYLKRQDTTLYGNYLSVWKKQNDGTWKYILDSGVNTPKPVTGK